jgi:hypothetical protein
MRGREEKYYCPECGHRDDSGGECPRCQEGMEALEGEEFRGADDPETPTSDTNLYYDDDPDAPLGYEGDYNNVID